MRILFMGTPDIAAHCLEALYGAGHTLCGVFTRQDKPVGRKQVLTAPPVKQVAMAHGTPVFQPVTLRDEAVRAQIRALEPEIIGVLAIPPRGCINLHVSLLPKYRGAAPVQWAVLNGDAETGVTIMKLDEGLDTGDILLVRPAPIGPEETSGELFDRITALGAETLLDALARFDELPPVPQDHAAATLAPPLRKEMAHFDFDADAAHLHNLVRGMNPWPVAFFEYGGKKIKVLASRVAEGSAQPGTILALKPFTVACASGALQLLQVVPEGGKPMEGSAWAAGRRFKAGDSL